MALRSGHGSGAGVPRIEVLPVDELPDGLPGDARAESPNDRKPNGFFAPGNSLAAAGGRARAGRARLASQLGLTSAEADPAFAPYRRSAEGFRRAQVARLASSVGAGECGPGPASIVASAALQLSASRFYFDRGEHELGSKLADASRQNLLASWEMCAKEAQIRGKHRVNPIHAAILGAGESEGDR